MRLDILVSGNGLHFSPRPFMAMQYAENATRFVACRVKVAVPHNREETPCS